MSSKKLARVKGVGGEGDLTRKKRVEALVIQALRQLFIFDIQDPRLAGLEITSVSMTGDLKTAYVNYVVGGPGVPRDPKQEAEIEKALKKLAGFLKQRLNQAVPLKYAIELKFFYDENFEKRMAVERLLNEIKSDRMGQD